MLNMTCLACCLFLTVNQTSVSLNVVSFIHRLSRIHNMAPSTLWFEVDKVKITFIICLSGCRLLLICSAAETLYYATKTCNQCM